MTGIPREKEEVIVKILQALSTTNNHPTLRADGISYCLLKLLKDTRLSVQAVGILADFLRGKRTTLSGLGDGREIIVVITPRTGKDWTKAKGWR